MEYPDLFTLFVRPVHRVGWPYRVSGSLASVHYGEPRLTMDVDLAVHLQPEAVEQMPLVFPEADYSSPPREVLLAELAVDRVARSLRCRWAPVGCQGMQRIELNPEICNGKPVIKGTRITVQTVLSFLSAGDSIDEILAGYPQISRDDVLACLAYAQRLSEAHSIVRLAS